MAQGRTVHQAGCGRNQIQTFFMFLKIKNRPLPKPPKLSPLFAAGRVVVIMENVFATQNVPGRKSRGNIAETEANYHCVPQPKGNWQTTT